MHLRKQLLLSIVVALCSISPAYSQVNGIEVANGATAQVFGGKSPAVSVTDAEGNPVASIPLDGEPGKYIYARSANVLYVVQNGKKGVHAISVIDLSEIRIVKQIEIGAGAEVELLLSGDERRLYCYTVAKYPSGLLWQGMSFYTMGEFNPNFEPRVDAIDTATNEVVRSYHLLDGRAADVPKNWFFGGRLLAAGNSGVLVADAKSYRGNSVSDRILIYGSNASQPRFILDPLAPGTKFVGGSFAGTMLSRDEKTLFLAIEGDKQSAGMLLAVDLEKGTLHSQTLTDHPTRLFRLGAQQEPWLMTDRQMLALSETGVPTGKNIPLSKVAMPTEGGAEGASIFVDGLPGETIPLGNGFAAIQINNTNGSSRHKVALIDLKKQQVEAVISTMSSGEIAGIRTKRYLIALGLSMATGGNVIFVPNFVMRNESLAARPDGRFLFALDLEGHEVTVVDVPAGAVVKRIPVNNSVIELQVSADGRHLICYGKKIQQIDLETNNLEN